MKDNYIKSEFQGLIKAIENAVCHDLIDKISEEYKVRSNKRMTYRGGMEIESFKMRISFLIDKGQWFKETIAFNIYTDAKYDFISVSEGFKTEQKLFKKTDIKGVIDYITKQINSQRILKKIKNKDLKYN